MEQFFTTSSVTWNNFVCTRSVIKGLTEGGCLAFDSFDVPNIAISLFWRSVFLGSATLTELMLLERVPILNLYYQEF